ncbi:MAG: carboxymuconolactone decarboxylase family protein [Pseudomonadota bacterium]
MLESDPIDETTMSPRVAAIFEEIRATRGQGHVNNFWRRLAKDEDLLDATWSRMRAVMVEESGEGLDHFTKELIYLAISIANGCVYCVHCHTTSARHLGMTEAQYADLLDIAALASQTNALATELKVPVDEQYLGDSE